MSTPVGGSEVPFTVDADLHLGQSAAPWLRDHGADVVVRRGSVPEELPGAEPLAVSWRYVHGTCLVKTPGGMRFWVEGGDTIRYEAEPGVDDVDIRVFLMGTPWAALALQRGLLPLHASAVSNGRSVVGFSGRPGEGKSTLAAALASRGHEFFADDVLIVDPDADDTAPLCWSSKDLKLWPDALELTGAAPGIKVRTGAECHKLYALPATMSPHVSGRLDELYMLETGSNDQPCSTVRHTGRQHVETVCSAVYRRRLAAAVLGKRQLFEKALGVGRNVKVCSFRRPVHTARLEDGLARIAEELPW